MTILSDLFYSSYIILLLAALILFVINICVSIKVKLILSIMLIIPVSILLFVGISISYAFILYCIKFGVLKVVVFYVTSFILFLLEVGL